MGQLCNCPSRALDYPTEASESKPTKCVCVCVRAPFPGSWAGNEAQRGQVNCRLPSWVVVEAGFKPGLESKALPSPLFCTVSLHTAKLSLPIPWPRKLVRAQTPVPGGILWF